jgi:hypothetical protein
MMHQHTPGARPVRQFTRQILIRHGPYQPNGSFKDAIIAFRQCGRRKFRCRIILKVEKIDDIGDDLRENKVVTARDNRNRARADTGELIAAAIVFENINRFEFDPTDRQVFFYPETARSMRLPENLDRGRHGVSFLSHGPTARVAINRGEKYRRRSATEQLRRSP